MASATTVESQGTSAVRRGRWGAFHLVFAAVAVAVLLQPLTPFGLRVLFLVVAYNVGVVAVALRSGDSTVLGWWCVLAPMSVMMVLPDWFLSAELGVLVFPDTGAPYLGTVPLFMAGMWVVALLPIVMVGHRVERAAGLPVALGVVAISGLVLFTAAEWLAPMLPLWHPVQVPVVAGVAPYVLLPEVGLALATYLLARNAHMRNGWATAAGIVAVPFLYLGMLASSYQIL